MKLVKFDGERMGLAIELSSGPHVIDIAASLDALSSIDPFALGSLKSVFDGGANWSALIEQWDCAGSGLHQLELLGRTNPHGCGVVVLSSDQVHIATRSTAPGDIATLEIVESPKATQNLTG